MSQLSVIIPCHNLGVFIEEAVASVMDQHTPDTEVIIVDDASNDSFTLDTLERLGVKYPSLCIIRTEYRSLGLARNAGLTNSSGRFVLFLDADDMIGEGFLKATVEKLEERPDCGVAFTNIKLFGLISGTWRTGPLFCAGEIYLDNYLQYCSLVRRSLIEAVCGFNPNVPGYEDWDFWIKLHEAGIRFIKVPDVYAFYRKRDDSMLAQSAPRRPYLINQLILNHKEAYGKLFACPVGELEESRVRELLRAGSGPLQGLATQRLRNTRLYRQFTCYSLLYRASRKVLAPSIHLGA